MGSVAHQNSPLVKIGPWWTLLLVALLLADLYHATSQYYTTPLDGDMPSGIVITWDVQKIFDDPLGLKVISSGNGHANPNRFFCHWAFASYFQEVPLFLQHFVDPISSAYLACALAKLFIHLGVILLLALFIRSRTQGGWRELIFLAVLITPLFQIDHYRPAIAIIDQSITYTFFYALPAMGLLCLVWFFQRLLLDPPKKPGPKIFLLLIALGLSFILPLSGPLIAPCVLLGSFVLGIHSILRHGTSSLLQRFHMNKLVYGVILFLILMSAYSLWLGTYNAIGTDDVLPIKELYSRLPIGLQEVFTKTPAIPIILAFILLNMIILHVIRYPGVKVLRNDMGWFLFFITLYLALLPLGGYRPWRENLIRFDTMIPFTLGLFYFYLATTWHVFQDLQRRKWLYGLALGGLLLHFTLTDLDVLFSNECEIRSMRLIADSNKEIVALPGSCHLISWEIITEPGASGLQAELLWRWRILDKPKPFYFMQDQ